MFPRISPNKTSKIINFLNNFIKPFGTLTLRTGTSICQRFNRCQIRVDSACISLIAASAGGCTGRNRASRQRSSRVSAPSVIPEWRQVIAFASVRLLLDRTLFSILLPIVLQYLIRVILLFRHNIIGYNNVHGVLWSWLFGHSVIRLRFRQFRMELAEYRASMRYQTQTLLQCRWYVAGRRKYHVIGIAIASTS